MTIFNLGSINIDIVYRVPRLPRPGETLAARSVARGLGGKGANQSLAAVRAGARVIHIGAVAAEGAWAVARLRDAGVDVTNVATVEGETGHAVILVDDAGENQIVIHGGANRAIPEAAPGRALATARPGDWFLAQNETSRVAVALARARAAGLRTAYAAAPFEPEAAAAVLPSVDLLAVNEGEAEALAGHLGTRIDAIPAPALLVTRGACGAEYRNASGAVTVPAFPVTAVDTTGAGDTFLGYVLAGLDAGADPGTAMRRAAAAAALQVMRPGAADAIPAATEVDAFLMEQDQ